MEIDFSELIQSTPALILASYPSSFSFQNLLEKCILQQEHIALSLITA